MGLLPRVRPTSGGLRGIVWRGCLVPSTACIRYHFHLILGTSEPYYSVVVIHVDGIFTALRNRQRKRVAGRTESHSVLRSIRIGEHNAFAHQAGSHPNTRISKLINSFDPACSLAKCGKTHCMLLVRRKPRKPPPQAINLISTGKILLLAVFPKIEILDVPLFKPLRKPSSFIAHQKRSEPALRLGVNRIAYDRILHADARLRIIVGTINVIDGRILKSSATTPRRTPRAGISIPGTFAACGSAYRTPAAPPHR